MKQAFSLVELSIVLVILGLLTGGILAGQSLIRAAELRSVSADYQRHISALQTFRDKYMAIPGDMRNATSFWGDDSVQCADAGIADGTPGTCNGNGDGTIADAPAANTTGEVFRYWQQLALAGLVEGSYTGNAGASSTADSRVGINVPPSKLSTAGWSVRNLGTITVSSRFYHMRYDNSLEFGTSFSGPTNQPILKPEEAWNIDTKVDDGRPAYGRLIAIGWDGTCAAADDGSNAGTDHAASYRLTDTTTQCALVFKQVF